MTRLAFCGNFSSPHTTEAYVAKALEHHGHVVERVQENGTDYATLAKAVKCNGAEVMFWTRTPSYMVDPDAQARWQADCARLGIVTVGLHLDKYWDLARQRDIFEHPFFRQDVVWTADGGNQDRFAQAGVNHRWWRPAVPLSRCGRGTFNPDYEAKVAFVGSQRYHPEWPWRKDLLRFLQVTYRRRYRQFGRSGDRLDDDQLADAYASVDVVVGDSCLVGGTGNYWSNRAPETIGRGGFLIHPHVAGMDAFYAEGEHIAYYRPGDTRGLRATIDRWLQDPEGRERVKHAGMLRVMESETFEVRMGEVLDYLGVPSKQVVG